MFWTTKHITRKMFSRHPEMGKRIWTELTRTSTMYKTLFTDKRQWVSSSCQIYYKQVTRSLHFTNVLSLLLFVLLSTMKASTCIHGEFSFFFLNKKLSRTALINKDTKLPIKWKAKALHKYFSINKHITTTSYCTAYDVGGRGTWAQSKLLAAFAGL